RYCRGTNRICKHTDRQQVPVRPGGLLLPGEAHAAAGPVGVTENAGGDDLAEGLQHGLQLLLVHGERQPGSLPARNPTCPARRAGWKRTAGLRQPARPSWESPPPHLPQLPAPHLNRQQPDTFRSTKPSPRS
ncbi:hypothetical protein ANANG_G00252210, partial [Anguilla anguilla]